LCGGVHDALKDAAIFRDNPSDYFRATDINAYRAPGARAREGGIPDHISAPSQSAMT
jgi:hypothetical protein